MRQRVLDTTKWLWYLLIISGPALKPIRGVKITTPPKNPATVEAQAKFFQDFFSVQLSPYKIEFGHVCEDPNTWEQRYERKDYKNHRDMGKVRWGDKKGGYGEHYWDLNHAGNAGNHGDGYDGSDDGSYHDSGDSYDEPNDQSSSYHADEYDPEAASKYEESGRAKRAHSKQKQKENTEHQVQRKKRKEQKQSNEQPEESTSQSEESDEEESQEHEQPPNPKEKTKYEPRDAPEQVREKNQVVLVVGHKDREAPEPAIYTPRQEVKHYVPYEGGAGIRQHFYPERQVTAATNAPRLFLEPSTGHVVDRATGQAYVLQPLIQNPNYK